MRRKEASAHHCNTKARARSVPVARMVSYSEGVWGSAATCAVMLGDSERACVDLWQGAPCWVGCFAGEPQVYTTRLWCWEGLGAGGEGDDRGWDGWSYHWLSAHGFGWTPGVGDGQRGLACCGSWGRKESDTTEQPNWTELMFSLAMYSLLGRFSWPGKSHGLRSLADYRLLWVQVHTRVIYDLATKPQQ